MQLPLLRAALDLPYDVVVDRILPRVLQVDDDEDEFPETEFPSTPRAVLEEVVCAVNDVFGGDEVRVRDLYASLLRYFSFPGLFADLAVEPRPSSVQRLLLSDCSQLFSSSDRDWHPTLRWRMEADRCHGPRSMMATTLLASLTGKRVTLFVNEIKVRGNTLEVSLQRRDGDEDGVRLEESIGSERASVASVAVVARRNWSRVGAKTYGELVLGKRAFCYQEARDALEASRFTMSEIKSLSSTTSVTYEAGDSVVVKFPNVMARLGESAGEELLLTVGACFVGLDLVHHMAYYPVRLGVLEELVRARSDSGQQAGVFSRLNRLDCTMRVLSSWEKRML